MIKAKINTHGEIIPIDIKCCPKSKYSERKVCQDRNCECSGLKNGKILKQDGQMEYTIQCNYIGSK